LLAVSDVN